MAVLDREPCLFATRSVCIYQGGPGLLCAGVPHWPLCPHHEGPPAGQRIPKPTVCFEVDHGTWDQLNPVAQQEHQGPTWPGGCCNARNGPVPQPANSYWYRQWTDSHVMCHSDNSAVVAQVNRLQAQAPLAAHLLRCLAFFQAQADFRSGVQEARSIADNGVNRCQG